MGDKTYKLNNKVYSIPQDRNEAFLNSYPDAKEVETFVLGQDTFDVPIDRVDAFLNKMPDAKPLSFQAKQKPVEGGGVATDVLDEEPPKLTQEQEVYLQAGRDDFNKQLGRSQYQPELSRIPQKERGEDVVPYTEQDQEQFIKDAEARDADIQKRKAGELTTEEAEKLGVAVSDRIKGMKEGIDLTIPIGEKAKTEGYYERQKQEKIKSLDAQESVLAKQRDDITKYYDDALKENPDLQSEAYLAYSKVNNELQKVINNKKELGVVPESNFSKLSNNELLSDKEELVDDYLKYLESDNKSGYNLLTDKLNQGKLNEKEQWDYIINPALQKRVDELQVNVEILKARGELPVAEVAEIYDLYNAYNLNKYRGEVKGDKFSYGEGSLKAFHLAVADSYEFFDNLGKSVADITGLGDALLEKGWKERGGAFKSLADWARTDVENLDELPPTWVGTALETSIGMTVLMGEMMLTPTLTVEKLPFMTSGAIVAIPKLMTLEGSKGFFNSYANNISDGKLTWKEIGESLEKGGKGAFYGALLHSMGVSSTGLSKFSAQFVKSKLLPVMVSTTAMGGMFTLYDAYNQWEQTGEIDWGEATAKGAGASILSIPYVSNALANDVYVKARSKYLASSDNLIKFALKLEEDPRSVDKRIKTLSKQISLLGDGKERSDLVNQRESLLNLVRIKFMAEDVISNPEKYRKEIRESDMPDESKDYFYQKITNTLLNVPEKKLSAPEFQRKVINNEIIRLQQRLFDLKNRNTEGQFDVDIKDINYQVDLHYKQLEEIKKYSGEPETKFKKEIEEREKKFQEYQAKMEDYIKKATVGMSVDKMVRPLVVPKNKDENEFNIRAVNNHIVELSKEIGKLKLEENPDKLAIQRKEIERDLFYGDLEDLKNEYYGPKETITTEKKLPGEAEKGISEEVLPGKEVKAGEKEVIEEKKPEEVKAEKDFIGFDKFAESIGTKEDVSDIVGERSRKGNIAGADVIIDVGSKDGFVKIESLSVPKEKRQQGIATKALDELISKADEQGLGLEVVAVPEEGADISKENLIKFYEKNGFEFEGDKGTRKPKEIKLEEKEAPKEAPLKKEPVKFDVDERVVFTAKDGKQYDVNFRGYVGDFTKAVIVGKVEDKIDQMQVDVSQLSKMPEGGLKPEKKPPEEKPKEVPPKEEGVPPEEKKPEEIPEEKTIDGVKYVRQKPGVVEVRGTKDEVKFSRKDYIPFEYAAIEADKLQPSHKGDLENPMFFNKEMQPKSRKGRASLKEQINIARKPRFKEISEGVIAYSGAPVVNERGEVVQGNNRAAGLITHYKNKGKIYKEDFIKNAEKFGLKGEDIKKMENPILVRVVDITDAKGKELGNYTVQDLETGGKDRIEAVPMAKRIPSDVKSKMANILFGGEEDIT
ncbi:GNAT family N-acetyltransferase, partial [Patescibacteria group bacterium]|nr:GNAT family N-acetyltransferase [Patescibacteria group bacterium]